MTANKRIVFNILATYGRTLLNVACGLFSARWVLEALGQTDFGLYGVIGGLVIFIEFLNGQFSGAISRFYGVSIGAREAAVDKGVALRECHAWFSTACSIHFVLPAVLMAIGYPIGIYALNSGWVSVPADRFDACIWVWRFACVNCLTAMMVAPTYAMFVARQNIAEMTFYGVGQTIVRTAFIYYMTTAPGDWLTRYGLAMCVIGVLPRILYSIQAFCKFEECRFVFDLAFDWKRIRKLCSFVSWETLTSLGSIGKSQGLSILVNNVLGARVNAAMAIGTQLAGETAALTGALLNAFSPAIITAYGAGDMKRVNILVRCVNKYGTLLVLLFAIPLLFELDGVLRLWLRTPPMHTAELAFYMVLVFLIEKLSQGQGIVITASGVIALHRALRCTCYLCALPIAWAGIRCGYGVRAVGLSLVVSSALSMVVDVSIARSVAGISVVEWFGIVIFRIIPVMAIVSIADFAIVWVLPSCWWRIFFTSALSAVVFLISGWFVAMTSDERKYLRERVLRKGSAKAR